MTIVRKHKEIHISEVHLSVKPASFRDLLVRKDVERSKGLMKETSISLLQHWRDDRFPSPSVRKRICIFCSIYRIKMNK